MSLEGKRVLYVSYNGMLDPLGQSQVIPYLKELSRKGVVFTLMSFEGAKAQGPEGSERCRKLRAELASHQIDWHWLRYHKRPSLPATSYDVLAGIRYGGRLVRTRQIEMVHARSHIAATIALGLKKRHGVKMIFDVRGLMAEEYVDADHWKEGNVPYRLTKSMESRALAAADGVVTLTEKIWPAIRNWKGLAGRDVIHEVVPCCTDLELFRFSEEDRARVRAELGAGNDFVLVYSGSVGSWYLADKMADFFVALQKSKPQSHFIWLTGGSKTLIDNLMAERAIPRDQYSVRTVAPSEVPAYLSAADAGIAFYKPAFSRQATSPVKVSEYLACGLPVIINAGVGDSDTFVIDQQVGAVVGDFSESGYQNTLAALMELLSTDVRTRARQAAERFLDVRTVGVQRYAHLYERVLNGSDQLN